MECRRCPRRATTGTPPMPRGGRDRLVVRPGRVGEPARSPSPPRARATPSSTWAAARRTSRRRSWQRGAGRSRCSTSPIPRSTSPAPAPGQAADRIAWVQGDVTRWTPPRTFALWHDRAVFHFLTDPEDRAAYVRTLAAALAPGGHAVISTFADDGPERCSGLPVARYSPGRLAATIDGARPRPPPPRLLRAPPPSHAVGRRSALPDLDPAPRHLTALASARAARVPVGAWNSRPTSPPSSRFS